MFEVVGQNRKEKPTWLATAISVAVHAAIVTLLVFGFRQTLALAGEGDRDDADPGRAGGGGGGGGGEQVSYYEVPKPPPPPPPPVQPEPDALVPPVVPPPPLPTPVPPAVQPRPAPPAAAPAAPGPGVGQGPSTGPGVGPGSGGGTGGGSGGGSGPGTGTGTGPGNGTGGGGGSRTTLPTSDLMLIPPNRPRGMTSRDVVLRLSINERGDVTDAEVLTPTGNRGYDEQLKRTARDWKFNPARDLATNRPVAVFYDVTFTI
ncbi:MAG: energy transducer TonB [Longimicrobiaceae bacterium]